MRQDVARIREESRALDAAARAVDDRGVGHVARVHLHQSTDDAILRVHVPAKEDLAHELLVPLVEDIGDVDRGLVRIEHELGIQEFEAIRAGNRGVVDVPQLAEEGPQRAAVLVEVLLEDGLAGNQGQLLEQLVLGNQEFARPCVHDAGRIVRVRNELDRLDRERADRVDLALVDGHVDRHPLARLVELQPLDLNDGVQVPEVPIDLAQGDDVRVEHLLHELLREEAEEARTVQLDPRQLLQAALERPDAPVGKARVPVDEDVRDPDLRPLADLEDDVGRNRFARVGIGPGQALDDVHLREEVALELIADCRTLSRMWGAR